MLAASEIISLSLGLADPSVNGVPGCADSAFQNDILRKQWSFEGFVVSDAGAAELVGQTRRHPIAAKPASEALSFNYTDSVEETCTANLLGGLDME